MTGGARSVGGKRLFADLRPLRESPDFRRFWAGNALSQVGSQMTTFAVALQVFTMTHSSLAVGAVGLCTALSMVTVGLLAGSIVDAVDRRKLVLLTRSAEAGVSALLAVQAYAGFNQLWLLYGLVVMQSAISAVSAPASQTFMPRLLRTELIPAGAALTMLLGHGSWTIGPMLAGVITAAFGLKTCYLIDALSFVAALYGVARLPSMRPEAGVARPGLHAVADGLRFIRRRQVLVGVLLADTSAMLFGMPTALFPAINAERFGGSPATLGLLSAGLSIGGIVGAAMSGPVGRVSRQGRAMLIAGALWGVGIVGFGLAHAFWLTMFALVVAGMADVVSVVFRTSMVQTATPDAYRGRVNSVNFVVGAGGPQLGSFRAGAVGSLLGPSASAVSGGLAVIVSAGLLALVLPALMRFRAGSTSHGGADCEPAQRGQEAD